MQKRSASRNWVRVWFKFGLSLCQCQECSSGIKYSHWSLRLSAASKMVVLPSGERQLLKEQPSWRSALSTESKANLRHTVLICWERLEWSIIISAIFLQANHGVEKA